MNKHDVIVQAVDKLKGSEFRATGIKVELEAQLGRERDEDSLCRECDGNWEGGRCENSCDDGYIRCEECDDGYIDGENDERVLCDEGCDEGWFTCEECDNEGWYSNCEYCEEGYVESNSNFSSAQYCHDWIMERLAQEGLATYEDTSIYLGHGVPTYWKPVYPLKYAEFYNDGSVDSELTFTLDLNESKNILLLPKFIEIFNEFADEAGTCFDTKGAGMHMALINSEDCSYPTETRFSGHDRLRNFSRSMQLLMPALFFLGSANENSRGLHYRNPGVGNGTHRTAIDYRGGALEFRLFDTCYDNPETVLDNVVVISKAMRYWSTVYRELPLAKITKTVNFGTDGDKLERLYQTSQQLDLLNAGLRILKPDYYTITDLKKQRNFKTTKTHVKTAVKRRAKDAEIEYAEYENRFMWGIDMRRYRTMNELIESHRMSTPVEKLLAEDRKEVLKDLEQLAEKEVKAYAETKQPLSQYVEQKITEFNQKRAGQYTLAI